jgi:hypothetical protein
MARKLVPLLVIASFALLVFAFAGCGGDDNSASGDTTATETTTTEETTTDTETTETETTETETTEDEGTDTTEASGDFATSANCREFAQIGTKISEALSGTEATDLDQAKAAFDDLTAAAPDEIKDDFEVIADAYSKMVDALQGVDLSNPNPDPATLQKLTQLGQELDQAKLTQASTNISTWARDNCGTG